MEKGKGKPPPVGDNYDNVNMEMSDESDNEMFACKDEYQAFKQHFDNKAKGQKNEDFSEYGGGEETARGPGLGIEYGSGAPTKLPVGSTEYGPPEQIAAANSEYGGGNSEYGGGAAAAAAGPSGPMRGAHLGYGHHHHRGAAGGYHHNSYHRRSPTPPPPTPAKIEREAKIYKDGEKDGGRRSKSR